MKPLNGSLRHALAYSTEDTRDLKAAQGEYLHGLFCCGS